MVILKFCLLPSTKWTSLPIEITNFVSSVTFKFALICEAHEKAKSGQIPNVTDDTKLVISMGKDVHLVEGSKQNFKITTFDDLMMLKALLKIGKTEVL